MAAKLSSFSVMVSMADICRGGEGRGQGLHLSGHQSVSSESGYLGSLCLIISITLRWPWGAGP